MTQDPSTFADQAKIPSEMEFSAEEQDVSDKEEEEDDGSRSADNDILSELQMK